jgi:hypothetical protein
MVERNSTNIFVIKKSFNEIGVKSAEPPKIFSINVSTCPVKVYKDDFKVEVVKEEPPKIIASDTSLHEADHSVVADVYGGIIEADVIRRGNTGGTTWPVRMTAPTAAAPAAMGRCGTSWDEYVVRRSGQDWSTAKAVARTILLQKIELRKEVAETLERKKKITQFDIDVAKRNVEERDKGIHPVRVNVYKSGVLTNAYSTKSFHGEIVVYNN